ncbi:hypothetical protein [Microvirga sp. TS319]|uniref:hypothetical protein n=1 Tax=Microvirga sp. TS319 TaxID=3241165 RepID=UPI00351A268C
MIGTIRTSLSTMMLAASSIVAMAQNAPDGTSGSPGTATPSPAATGAVADGDMSTWLWVVLAVVIIAGLLYYFLGRGRATRI